MNRSAAYSKATSPDWTLDFISDQAHQFLRTEMEYGATMPGPRDNKLLERCIAHLMAICNCSMRTAETHAAQAICEISCRGSRISLDADRSTSLALFVVDRATGKTRVISAAELMSLMLRHEAVGAPLSA